MTKKAKKITPQDNAANIQNPNRGVPGQNKQRTQNQDNRGKQLQQQKNPKP